MSWLVHCSSDVLTVSTLKVPDIRFLVLLYGMGRRQLYRSAVVRWPCPAPLRTRRGAGRKATSEIDVRRQCHCHLRSGVGRLLAVAYDDGLMVVMHQMARDNLGSGDEEDDRRFEFDVVDFFYPTCQLHQPGRCDRRPSSMRSASMSTSLGSTSRKPHAASADPTPPTPGGPGSRRRVPKQSPRWLVARSAGRLATRPHRNQLATGLELAGTRPRQTGYGFRSNGCVEGEPTRLGRTSLHSLDQY